MVPEFVLKKTQKLFNKLTIKWKVYRRMDSQDASNAAPPDNSKNGESLLINRINKMRLVIPFLIIIFLNGCKHSKDFSLSAKEPLNLHGNIIVYVEAHKKGEDVTAGDFDDVVVLNIDTQTKYRITDDTFVDEYPVLSPDRKVFVFATRREGNGALLKIMGMAGQRGLFRFEPETKEMKPFAQELQAKHPDFMDSFKHLSWAFSGDFLYYVEGNAILRISSGEDSLQIFHRFEDIENIFGFKPYYRGDSRRLTAIAIDYIQLSGRCGLSIFDLVDTTIAEVENRSGGVHLGGWNQDGSLLLYKYFEKGKYHWIEYDVKNKIKRPISIPGSESKLYIESAEYLDSSNLILYGGKNFTSLDTIMGDYSENNEILKFNLHTRNIEWLTNDGYKKEYFTLYNQQY